MRTKFDGISDEQIEHAFNLVTENERYPERESDLRRIANLAWNMERWQCWFGPPLTFYESVGLEFDGQHRCRAVKFLARRRKVMIQVPLRYSTGMKE